MSLLVIYKDILVNHIATYLTREDLFVLSYVCKLYHGYFWRAYRDGVELCESAAKRGHLTILQWLRSKKCPWDIYTCAYAAKGGHLEVLKWARENECDWNANTCTGAAEGGHLEVLKWARENDCDWNSDTCTYAAENGHLEVLKWLRANGCDWNVYTCSAAARYGHLEVLKWARQNGCDWDEDTCYFAASGGHLEVLKWLRANGCDWDHNTCANAAEGGHLEVLKWCRENGCDWNANTCTFAAGEGQLDVLKWCRENGCDWDEYTCAYAAGNGHLEVLKWLRQNGCEWDVNTCEYAAKGGHLEVLKWARANGCEWTKETCLAAAKKGHLAILQWALDNGCDWDEDMCIVAAGREHMNVVTWLRENGYPEYVKYQPPVTRSRIMTMPIENTGTRDITLCQSMANVWEELVAIHPTKEYTIIHLRDGYYSYYDADIIRTDTITFIDNVKQQINEGKVIGAFVYSNRDDAITAQQHRLTVTDVYVDGSCLYNPSGPGGWGWAIKPLNNEEIISYNSGHVSSTTNQRMELQAPIEAITSLNGKLRIHGDSAYVVNCFKNGWWKKWRVNGWKSNNGGDVKNRDLWERLLRMCIDERPNEIEWVWVKGHSGVVMNEFVDKLANKAAHSSK